MSVAELPSGPDVRSSRDSARDRDRTPPQDVAAEQSVLGAMLLSKDAIADVVEVLRGNDFYKPAHEVVYEAVLDLYGRGEPADAVTVVAELTKRGEIGRVGGAPYVHTLISMVPTAANAGYYAQIVRERALLRRLVEAGTKIVQMGYAADGGEADEIVDRAQAELYQVSERRTSEDYAPLAEIMEGALDEIEAIGSRGGQLVGVPTGFVDLDQLTNGLHPGQMVVLAARPAVGKALALDTPLPTPRGWTRMGRVEVGGYLLGADGRPTRVLAVTEVLRGRPCYEVIFSDGSRVVADGQHQWLVETPVVVRQVAPAGPTSGDGRRDEGSFASVRTTEGIAGMFRRATADRRPNLAVATTEPLDLPARALPLPPYVLGTWLGGRTHAGGVNLTGPEIAGNVDAVGDHRIPAPYLRASRAQRRALLAGLLDAEGYVTGDGRVQVRVDSSRLAEDVHELVVSLGYRCSISARPVRGRTASSTTYLVDFTAVDDVFRLSSEGLVHRDRRRGTSPTSPFRGRSRFITDVRAVPSVPVRCVRVDAADQLFLAGRSMIPTHNSTLGLDVARSASIKHGLATVIFSLEMGRNEITMRLLSAEARVALHHMRSGTMNEDDWNRLARRMGEVSAAPLFIDDSPNMTMMEIRAKCRRLKQRHDLKLVVIDYLQLMTSGKKVESRQQEVSEFSRAIKLLAKELEVPVIAISQLNRGSEQRTDKRPQLSDLRESGCLTAETRVRRADTGAEVTLGELYASAARDVPVWSLNERLELEPRTMTHVFSSGVKEIYRLRLASGRRITATANHPFLTRDGWTPLRELAPGSRVGVVLDRSRVDVVATGVVVWEPIVDVRHVGVADVYDATVLGTHNFVANGVAVHNSIEQDADMVILLHREELYERESPRAGEADFIVAKHRNGPTATVTVAFQGHYSRFVDMAQM